MEASISENGIPNILSVNGHDRFHYTLKHVNSNIIILFGSIGGVRNGEN
ncbi:MAG: hypothetical protein ABFD08_08225 [Syntrophomonas sp.]